TKMSKSRVYILGNHVEMEATDAGVLEVDRLVEPDHGGMGNGDVEEVVRHELQEVERLQLALHAKRGTLDLACRLDHPDVAVERAAGEFVVEALERLGAREEHAPRVVERREVLAQG